MLKKLLVLGVIAAFAAADVTAQTKQKPKTQSVSVHLTERGYKPSSFRLKKGIRARLTFVRKTDATCGQVLLIPAYGIQRDLPLNQPVTVSFIPRNTGTFNFTCGMNMLRGKIIVN